MSDKEQVMLRIPLYKPDVSGNEKHYISECVDTGWISSKGKFVSLFEEAFSTYLGVPYCASVCNGTAALQTALGALGIGLGDEVIVPTLTYVASANAVRGVGATPVFVESLSDSWQMDPDDVRRKISERTRAILVVHLYGGVCEMDKLVAIAREHDLFLVEDCAEAFGSRYDGAYAGTFGDVAAFSFYGNKTISTGEGGMVMTASAELHEKVWAYKSQGVSREREYWHESLGFNFRMTNLCAAIGLAQLERADTFLVQKRQIATWYQEHLRGLPVEIQPEPANVHHTYWLVSILCHTPESVNPLREALAVQGIETRPVFPPLHTMPLYGNGQQVFACAENIAARGISLPSWPGLQEKDVAFVSKVIKRFHVTVFS